MQKLRPRKKSGITKIIVGIAVILLAAIGWFIWVQHTSGGTHSATGQGSEKLATFSGTVTARNNGCAYDDVCTVSVDGRVIVTGGGLAANPNANIYGAADADLRIGDKVRVKALSTGQGLTLQGCRDCYITRGGLQR